MTTLNKILATTHVATILVVIFAIVGGAMTVIHPDQLSFADYLNDMSIAVAGLGVGRGLMSGLALNRGGR